MSRRPRSNRVALTARDTELLASVAELRFVTARQLERLHFASAQTAARRLRLLDRAGLLKRKSAPMLGTQLIALTESGAVKAAERLGWPDGCIATGPSSHAPMFLQHQLAITDFRIALELACRARRDLRIRGFLADYAASRNGKKAPERRLRLEVRNAAGVLAHCPDGAFALERGGQPALFFLEVDRGSEVVGDTDRGVGKAVRFYLHLLVGGGYQQLQEEFAVHEEFRGFRALLVATSEARLRSIRERCGASPFEPAAAKRFVWLATGKVLESSRLLDHAWVSLDPGDATHYRIAPERAGGDEPWPSR